MTIWSDIVVRVWVGQNESFHLLVEIDICFSKLHCLDAKVLYPVTLCCYFMCYCFCVVYKYPSV